MRIFGRRDAGEPVASYAAVLDGRHLWWHVPGHGRLTLQAADGGVDVAVETDPFALTGLAAASYDVLAGGRPVRVASLPERRPSRAPVSPDGVTQYDVTAAGGQLRLIRRPVADAVAGTATLDAVEVRGDRLHLRVTPPHGVQPGVHLVLLDDADQPLGLAPLVATEGHLDALLGVEDLPAGYFGTVRLAVGGPEDSAGPAGPAGSVRIRRAATDLADPDRAVLLPELADERHPDRVRARLRWSPDSLLVLRCLDPDAGDAGDAGGGAAAGAGGTGR